MRQSAFLVFNQIMVDKYAAFFNCTPVGRASMMAPTVSYSFWMVVVGAICLLLGQPGINWSFSFAPDSSNLFGAQGSTSSGSSLNL